MNRNLWGVERFEEINIRHSKFAAQRFGYRRLFILLRREGERSGINRIYRLYREEGLTVRKRRARRRAVGTRAPILVEAKTNARWSLDFVHDQFACGRRFFIHESLYDRFAGKAEALKVGNGLEDGTQMGPMIAKRRLDAMQAFVDDDASQGAEVLTGGKAMSNRGYFFEPTVLKDVPETARIMSEEPFGPIAPLTSFSAFDEVVERANALAYGLASFTFTRSGATAMKTEEALDAGLVGVNHMAVSTPETPFGGVNESGYGSESGIEGLDAFLRTKFVTEFALS